MNENNYGEPDFNITASPAESQHPVLTQLHEKIAELETKLADMTEREDKQRSRAWELSSNFANYKFKLENVLRTYAQDNEDFSSKIVEMADEMDIELLNTKTYDVNVTFTVTVTAPFGEEIDLGEYDVDPTIDISGYEFELDDSGVNYVTEA